MNSRKSRSHHVAAVNKDIAKNNIICKKNILESWAVNGIPFSPLQEGTQSKTIEELEYFPRSIRQFNFWDGSANSDIVRSGFPRISRNANETLRSHPILKELVADIIDALIAREIFQKNQSRPVKIKKLGDALAVEKLLRTIVEAELVNVRKQQREEFRKYNDETAGLHSQITEFKKLISALQAENKDAAKEISKLKGQLVKIIPLKGV